MTKTTNLFISVWGARPSEISKWLANNRIRYDKWEGQPQADQIKLHNVSNLPVELPDWVRKED